MRELITGIVAVLMALVFMVILSVANLWLALAVSFLLALLFIPNAIQEIPATPPQNAVLTFLGRRQSVQIREGWAWIPFFPFIFDFKLIKMEKRVSLFGPQKVRTPDNAVISTSESVVWIPGIEGNPGALKTFLDSGGDAGVEKILGERVEDRIKTWGSSNQEGPSTWREALSLRDDAHVVLARALLGAHPLTVVDSPIPTCVWMRFFNTPQSPPTSYDVRPENKWANIDKTGRWNWKGLEKEFNKLSPEEQEALRAQVKKRREEVTDLRGARGKFADPSLGITILGFSVGEIQAEGKVAEAAESEEKERLERKGDTVEVDNFAARAIALKTALPGLSDADALEGVQVILGKTPKRVVVVKGAQTGLGQDLIGAIGVHQFGDSPGTGNPRQGSPQGNPQGQGSPQDSRSQRLADSLSGKPKKGSEMTEAELEAEFGENGTGLEP